MMATFDKVVDTGMNKQNPEFPGQDHVHLSPLHVWTVCTSVRTGVPEGWTHDNSFLVGQNSYENAVLENVFFPALAVNLVPTRGYW